MIEVQLVLKKEVLIGCQELVQRTGSRSLNFDTAPDCGDDLSGEGRATPLRGQRQRRELFHRYRRSPVVVFQDFFGDA